MCHVIDTTWRCGVCCSRHGGRSFGDLASFWLVWAVGVGVGRRRGGGLSALVWGGDGGER
jgi:hypothetical protein